jgi:hypothetical protein
MRRTPWLLLLSLPLVAAACADPDDGPSPYDDDYAVSGLDPLFQGAPNNDDLPEEGKADAVYPRRFTELLSSQSPVKSQGSRGVCSIFATVALMEHLYLKEGSLPNPDFSEQFLQWSAKAEARGFTTTEGSSAEVNLRAVSQFGIVGERDWAYQSTRWTATNDPACTGGESQPVRCYTNGEPPASALAARRWKLPSGKWVRSTASSIKAHLTSKKTAAVAGMTFFYQAWNHRRSELPVNSEYWRQGYVLYPNARDKELSLAKRAGHAILIVGWDDDLEVPVVDERGEVVRDAAGKPVVEKGFWIFKNSWGTGSFGVDNPHGDGYGMLSMRYVQEFGTVYVSGVPTVALPAEACDSGLDEDLDGAVDCDDTDCAGAAICQPEPQVRTYTAAPNLSIPDNAPAGVASTIAVADAGVVGAATVTVDIAHTYRGDLEVRLVHAGTTIVLHDNTGAGDDNLQATFDLPAMAGKALAGDWVLQVADTAAVDTGTLRGWSLEVITN